VVMDVKPISMRMCIVVMPCTLHIHDHFHICDAMGTEAVVYMRLTGKLQRCSNGVTLIFMSNFVCNIDHCNFTGFFLSGFILLICDEYLCAILVSEHSTFMRI
jgi:hypothetical protein